MLRLPRGRILSPPPPNNGLFYYYYLLPFSIHWCACHRSDWNARSVARAVWVVHDIARKKAKIVSWSSWRCFFLWLSSCMSVRRRHKARLPKLRTAPLHRLFSRFIFVSDFALVSQYLFVCCKFWERLFRQNWNGNLMSVGWVPFWLAPPEFFWRFSWFIIFSCLFVFSTTCQLLLPSVIVTTLVLNN